MNQMIENWFVLTFLAGLVITLIGVVLMIVYRKPDVSYAQLFLTGTEEEPYPSFLKPRLKMVRREKIRFVYGLTLTGISIVMLGVLALAGRAILGFQ